MPLLPKPYPDEVFGSIVARAMVHNGLKFKQQARDLFGIGSSNCSFLMASNPKRLASLAGLEAEQLLVEHTMFPFATAFLPHMDRQRLLNKALSPRSKTTSIGSLTKNISHGVEFRRICKQCVHDDLAAFGESYWRRSHMLPGVLFCPTHGSWLFNTTTSLRGNTNSRDYLLPDALGTTRIRSNVELSVLKNLASIALDALAWRLPDADARLVRYRGQALQHGYALKSGMVASKALCRDVAATYGDGFLEAVGCAMSARRPWPAQMLRPEIPCAYSSAKHLLLSAYLERGPESPPDVASEYRKPGRRPTDFRALDAKTVERLKLLVKLMKERYERKTVKCLMKDAGAWELFRHNRERFPLTTAFLAHFRKTDQSERQVGGREYWRARHPQRFGLNSGPQA